MGSQVPFSCWAGTMRPQVDGQHQRKLMSLAGPAWAGVLGGVLSMLCGPGWRQPCVQASRDLPLAGTSAEWHAGLQLPQAVTDTRMILCCMGAGEAQQPSYRITLILCNCCCYNTPLAHPGRTLDDPLDPTMPSGNSMAQLLGSILEAVRTAGRQTCWRSMAAPQASPHNPTHCHCQVRALC